MPAANRVDGWQSIKYQRSSHVTVSRYTALSGQAVRELRSFTSKNNPPGLFFSFTYTAVR
jgi:hypothetical protein